MNALHGASAVIDGREEAIQIHERSARLIGDTYHVTVERIIEGRRIRTLMPISTITLDTHLMKLAGIPVDALTSQTKAA